MYEISDSSPKHVDILLFLLDSEGNVILEELWLKPLWELSAIET